MNRALLILILGLAPAAVIRADPDPARAVQVASDLRVVPIADGVWMHTSWRLLPGGVRFPSNGLLVREGDHLVLVDTAWGEEPTRELLDWAERSLKLPITRAVVTHAHDDRMGGAPVLATRGIPFWSHPLTGPRAAKQGWPQPRPLTGLTTPDSSIMQGSIEIFYPGPAHTVDNLMVWIPAARVLFGGCAVKDLRSQTLGNVADADQADWPLAVRRAQERYREAVLIVPGHGAPGGLELLQHTLGLCRARP